MGAKSFLKVLCGSLVIAVGINLFFTNYNILPAGIFGFDVLYSTKCGMPLGTTIFLVNLFFLLLGYLTLPKSKLKMSLISFVAIPVFTVLTSKIDTIIDITSADKLLIAVFGGVVIGLGCELIYKDNRLVSASDLMEEIGYQITGYNSKIVSYVLDAIFILFAYLNFGVESAMYSFISIIIIEIMIKRSTIGISESKVFYIITKEDIKVKRYIMDELHCDLTIFDSKGGFSHSRSKILMSVIPTKDYYKLREGVKKIDPNAFIAITDSYEIINENVAINR